MVAVDPTLRMAAQMARVLGHLTIVGLGGGALPVNFMSPPHECSVASPLSFAKTPSGVVLAHHRRRVLHFNVTEHPTADWTAQQIVDTFPDDTAPAYLLRDRDRIYGDSFRRRVKGMQIHEVLTAPRRPWQNPFVERLSGSIRRACLDHVLVLSESHLRRILIGYFVYYHHTRTHLSLDKDAPGGLSSGRR